MVSKYELAQRDADELGARRDRQGPLRRRAALYTGNVIVRGPDVEVGNDRSDIVPEFTTLGHTLHILGSTYDTTGSWIRERDFNSNRFKKQPDVTVIAPSGMRSK